MKKITWLAAMLLALACSAFAPAHPVAKKKAKKHATDCSTCTGAAFKCINNVCEEGILTLLSSGKSGTKWACTYCYTFSDGSKSASWHVSSNTPCMF